MTTPRTVVRSAERGDEDDIHGLITELAHYEKAAEKVRNTPDGLRVDLFDDEVCSAFVADTGTGLVGFALYYTGYSTWNGRTLYLEDFYVQPSTRGTGVGRLLFDAVVAEAKRRGVRRMDWQVLDWNDLAIDFYTKYDAVIEDDWLNCHLFFG